jgi:hypothetical protein
MAKLGATYTDKITGFSGVATGYVQYLTGCNQVLIQPRVDSEGRTRDSSWFDEQRLDIDTRHDVIVLNNGNNPGSDKQAPKR